MKLSLFATAGYTEVGGLQHFLEAWLPKEVTIALQFPAAMKRRKAPALLRARPHDRPGLTGKPLITEVERRIRAYGVNGDAVLVVDDADCRFGCERREGFDAWRSHVTERLQNAAGREDLPVFLLLAAPEMEAWLLADVHSTFADEQFLGGHYRAGNRPWLLHALSAAGWERPEGGWESYGCPPLAGGGCSQKLSTRLAEALQSLDVGAKAYSKRDDGVLLLQRARPEVVAHACPVYAGPELRRLRDWASQA